VRLTIAAAAGLLLVAAPGTATAGSITPIQYAYGGGSNAAAVIATQPPASQTGGQSTQSGGVGSTGGSGSANGGRSTGTTAQPLVGLAGSTAAGASPASSFDALHRAIPTDALWAIALAAACGLGAWLVRRGST
jgi:hypothetical protein